MYIKSIGIGNQEESYIEKSFDKGMNIISSDDNNKGKTIVLQSILYTLGNVPTFPSSFKYKEYIFILEFEVNAKTYWICRKNNDFIIKNGEEIRLLNSTSELKKYYNSTILELPQIIKNELPRIVDLELIIQMFFLAQDTKDTSNISNKGFYNKNDFINMLVAMCTENAHINYDYKIEELKNKIKTNKQDKRVLKKQLEILTNDNKVLKYFSNYGNKLEFQDKCDKLNEINGIIATLEKERNREVNKLYKWDQTLKELNSLNREINVGQIRCLDCNSTNIMFVNSGIASYAFDISSVNSRNEIINTIKDNISACKEEIKNKGDMIETASNKFKEYLADPIMSIEYLTYFKKDIFGIEEVDFKICELDKELNILAQELENYVETNISNINNKKELLSSIKRVMQDAYSKIDDESKMEIESIFTKKAEIYSGSQATVYHLVKLYALQKCIKHSFPIIIDSFRAEDLSSEKENLVISLFEDIENQKIFTTTLKNEEIGKYDNIENINHIDYNNYKSNKLLGAKSNPEFHSILKEKFGITQLI